MNTESRPSIVRIISTHYISFIAAFTPTILWIFFFIDYLQGDEFMGNNMTILSSITFVALVLILWNVTSIFSTFRNGVKVKAVVHSVGFFRGRGTILFDYTFQGEKYRANNTVLKNVRTRDFAAGQNVDVLVDANHPKRAVIEKIYLQG